MNLLESLTAGFADLKTEIKNAFATKAALESDLSAARAELVTVRASLADATAKLTVGQTMSDGQAAELVTLRADLAARDATIATLQADAKTAEARAAAIVAGQGLPVGSLAVIAGASAGTATKAEQINKLRQQIGASENPQERYKLSMQIKELFASK